jgi:hypothetical protein
MVIGCGAKRSEAINNDERIFPKDTSLVEPETWNSAQLLLYTPSSYQDAHSISLIMNFIYSQLYTLTADAEGARNDAGASTAGRLT